MMVIGNKRSARSEDQPATYQQFLTNIGALCKNRRNYLLSVFITHINFKPNDGVADVFMGSVTGLRGRCRQCQRDSREGCPLACPMSPELLASACGPAGRISKMLSITA